MPCARWRPSYPLMALAIAFSLPAAGDPVQAQASLPPSLELRVPKPPTIARGAGASFLAHELHLTNFMGQAQKLTRVDVVEAAGGRTLQSLSDSALAASLTRPGQQLPAADRPVVAGGSRAVVYLWVPVDGNAPPAAIRHRVVIQQGTGDSIRVQELVGPAVPVAPARPSVGAPLAGGVWLTANGPHRSTGHRRGLLAVEGVPTIAQRFAIDYVMVDDQFRTFNGDRLKNEDYYAYGRDAIAVADGMVVATKDSIPENVPGPASRAVPITLETVGGNFVILDIGGGHYAFYAHLQPGSLRVRVGDRVRRGQVVGLVGNSGNSTEPHLHFHISDGASPLGSEGLPYHHDAFEQVGQCRSFNLGCELATPVTRRGETPMGNTLVRFPGR